MATNRRGFLGVILGAFASLLAGFRPHAGAALERANFGKQLEAWDYGSGYAIRSVHRAEDGKIDRITVALREYGLRRLEDVRDIHRLQEQADKLIGVKKASVWSRSFSSLANGILFTLEAEGPVA